MDTQFCTLTNHGGHPRRVPLVIAEQSISDRISRKYKGRIVNGYASSFFLAQERIGSGIISDPELPFIYPPGNHGRTGENVWWELSRKRPFSTEYVSRPERIQHPKSFNRYLRTPARSRAAVTGKDEDHVPPPRTSDALHRGIAADGEIDNDPPKLPEEQYPEGENTQTNPIIAFHRQHPCS